jgi:hypothetical protein
MVDTTLAGACGLYCEACGIYRMYKDKDTERLEGAAREVFHWPARGHPLRGLSRPL